uniref:MADF domain-containing protein n=1 Tax=Anopheles dirus TaxID=7168 RepID=A0A182NV89_9DIPT
GCLWNLTHEDHSNGKARVEAWQSLSLCLGYDADDLFDKWQSLRSTYRHCKSRLKSQGTTVQWKYFSPMSFIDGFTVDEESPTVSHAPTVFSIKPKDKLTTDSNRSFPSKEPGFVAVNGEAATNEVTGSGAMLRSKHPTNHATIPSMFRSHDEDLLYVQTIALQMKQFSPKTKRKLQIEIHELIVNTQKRKFEQEFGHTMN